jgi:hypothetical protein
MPFLAVDGKAGEPCHSVTDGPGLQTRNTIAGIYYGRAADQVFVATGRAISGITVWKAPSTGNTTSLIGSYICETETLGTGEVRSLAVRGIIAVGPVITFSGAHESSAPLDFRFDPPVVLGHPGQFAFAIRDEQSCGGIFALEAASGDPYKGGDMWTTGPQPSCAYGAYPGYPVAPVDLCFTITYCDATPVRSTSWGGLRALYR